MDEPNGLLAIGGDLAPERLLSAYRRGIFPWYSSGQPILWWCPDPRAVLFPQRLHVSRRLHRRLRKGAFTASVDRAFAEVVDACAAPRPKQSGTWITSEMRSAYLRLHALGYARSIEVWHEGVLAGGMYGVTLGRVFFGESMFTRVTDASKVAMHHLCGMGYQLVDCQVPNPHLQRMGAEMLRRRDFLSLLARLAGLPAPAEAS